MWHRLLRNRSRRGSHTPSKYMSSFSCFRPAYRGAKTLRSGLGSGSSFFAVPVAPVNQLEACSSLPDGDWVYIIENGRFRRFYVDFYDLSFIHSIATHSEIICQHDSDGCTINCSCEDLSLEHQVKHPTRDEAIWNEFYPSKPSVGSSRT